LQYIANVFKIKFSNHKVKVFNSLDEFQPIENVVVTIGTFDGVHFGHQQLIQRVNQKAAEINGSSLILTFFPHPRMILYPEEHGIELLNTIREKQTLLEQEGIDNLLILPFDATFAEISSEEFIRKILVEKLKTKVLIIGYDHRFGKNREGSIDDLLKFAPEFGFEVEQIPEQDVNEIAVSSTQIRKSLKRGDVATAAAFLGRPFTLTGTVVQGNKIGRTIGFPTANLQIVENYKLIPL
jgi:riboflavin kinase/FMN adenylyltransferase